MPSENITFLRVNAQVALVSVIRLLAFLDPGCIGIIRVGYGNPFCLLLFTVLRHDLYDLSRFSGRLDDGCINDGTFSYQKAVGFELPRDLFKKFPIQIEIYEGISESTDGRVIRQGAHERKSTETDKGYPVIEGFL